MCTIRIARSKRINKTRLDQRLIGRTSVREWNESTIYRTWLAFRFNFLGNEASKEKKFILILLLLLLLVFTFSIDPSYHFSRTDNDVSLFLKCILSIASRPSSPRNDSIPPPQEKSPCAVPNIHFCASLCASYYADVVEFLSNLFQILH